MDARSLRVGLAIFALLSGVEAAAEETECRPIAAAYHTGSTNGIIKTRPSVIAGDLDEVGWATFDISAIPDDNAILSVTFHYVVTFCDGGMEDLVGLWALDCDPVTTGADELYDTIMGSTEYYAFFPCHPSGWQATPLLFPAMGNLADCLVQDWFAFSLVFGGFDYTQIYLDGWAEPHVPYIVVRHQPHYNPLHVDDDAPGDPGPGDPAVSDPLEDGSAEHPFDAIAEAIHFSREGDTILVADGRYTGDGNHDLDFLGKAITVRSMNGPDSCVIDVEARTGGGGIRGFHFQSAEGPDSIVEGFTITGGDGGYEEYGGGILCESAGPTIRGNVITGNRSCYGAGICCWIGATPLIEGNLISGNQMQYSIDTGTFGGGIFAYQSGPVVIRDNRICWNSADLYSSACAVYGQESTVELTNNLIAHNGVVNDPPFAAWEMLGFHDCQVLIRSLTLADNDIVPWGEALSIGSGTTAVIAESILRCEGIDAVYVSPEGTCTLHYSDVEGGWPGEGNIDADPLFVAGPQGEYYLSQISAGQAAESPCVDTGDPASPIPDGTTRTDGMPDVGVADMGYHYPLPVPREPRLVIGLGAGYGNPPLVRVFPPAQDAAFETEFSAYGSPHHGVNVACGDVTGDGLSEILTGAGPGSIYGPHVRGFAPDGSPLPGLSFFAYGTHRWGVNVTAGDLDGDGREEVVTGAGPGAVFGPHVRAFAYSGSGVAPLPGVSYFAYGTHKWGVNIAAGDLDGDGMDEIVTGPGPGEIFGPHVRGWNVDGGTVTPLPGVSFFAFGSRRYGVVVACGDLDGDGMDEILTTPGPAGAFGTVVLGWNFDGGTIAPLAGYSFFAWPPTEVHYGARLGCADLDGDGREELVVGAGPDPSFGSTIKALRYDGSEVSLAFTLEAFPPEYTHGVNAAAGRF